LGLGGEQMRMIDIGNGKKNRRRRIEEDGKRRV
jgi:hypothetical protein